VVDGERRLVGTITDGDIRRIMLEGQSLDKLATELLAHKTNPLYAQPVTAPVGTDGAELLRLMQDRDVRQVPLLDAEEHVAGLVTMDDLLPDQMLPLQAVIMAGGRGTRLRPLTEEMPKSMLPVGDRPLMELIIEQLRQAGIRIRISTIKYR